MKTYEKPVMETVSSQTESLLVHNSPGDGIQLSKENSFIFDDDSSNEDEL